MKMWVRSRYLAFWDVSRTGSYNALLVELAGGVLLRIGNDMWD
jgi:hypothetical protein